MLASTTPTYLSAFVPSISSKPWCVVSNPSRSTSTLTSTFLIQANRDNAQSIIDHLISLLASPPVDAETALPDATASLLSITGASPVASTSRAPASKTNLLTPSYRLILTKTILAIGSADMYAAIPNFVWYLSVLIDLAYISRVDVGREIRAQIVEIAGRVRDVRPSAVDLLGKILQDGRFLESAANGWQGVYVEGGEKTWGEIVAGAAWVCGEHAEFLSSPAQVAMLLLEPDVACLSPGVQSVCIHASAKIFAFWAAKKASEWDSSAESGDVVEVRRVLDKLVDGLGPFLASEEEEVTERASEVGNLFAFVKSDLSNFKSSQPPTPAPQAAEDPDAFPDAIDDSLVPHAPTYPKSLLLLAPLFTSHPLPPVSSRAQSSIALPEGLDLSRPLYDFSSERAALDADDSEESEDEPISAVVRRDVLRPDNGRSGSRVRTKEEDELLRVVAASAAGGRPKKKGKGKARENEDPEEKKAVSGTYSAVCWFRPVPLTSLLAHFSSSYSARLPGWPGRRAIPTTFRMSTSRTTSLPSLSSSSTWDLRHLPHRPTRSPKRRRSPVLLTRRQSSTSTARCQRVPC